MSYRRKMGDNHRLQKTYRATRNYCLVGVYYDRRKGRLIMKASSDVQEFTTNVGIELKSVVLAAIVAAQDEYIRVLQNKSSTLVI